MDVKKIGTSIRKNNTIKNTLERTNIERFNITRAAFVSVSSR